jgi:hypothetical protein
MVPSGETVAVVYEQAVAREIAVFAVAEVVALVVLQVESLLLERMDREEKSVAVVESQYCGSIGDISVELRGLGRLGEGLVGESEKTESRLPGTRCVEKGGRSEEIDSRLLICCDDRGL